VVAGFWRACDYASNRSALNDAHIECGT
jgi:hypothetical protein